MDRYIQVSHKQLVFNTGDTEKSFTISIGEFRDDLIFTEEPYIAFSLSGLNKHSYRLTTEKVVLVLDSSTFPDPVISNLKVDNTFRTSVNVSLSVNVPSTIYYAYFLAGSPPLSAE